MTAMMYIILKGRELLYSGDSHVGKPTDFTSGPEKNGPRANAKQKAASAMA